MTIALVPRAAAAALSALAAVLALATSSSALGQDPELLPRNVLLIVADDVGLDNVGAYGLNPEAARTPNIDELAERGVLFRNAYANPVCSPSRATILTGRYAWRTGLGSALVFTGSNPGLALAAPTLADVLSDEGYATAAVGKWHLATTDTLHPLKAGFDHHLGSMGNIADYFAFPKNVDGTIVTATKYATTDTVDDAITFIDATGPETPWFLWVAFNSAHAPFHAPPPELHGYDIPPLAEGIEPLLTKAMIEAMDTEIGRLLDAVDLERTVVVFVGDNGPDALSVTPPWDPTHAKHTLFDLGVHVALVVAGPGVVQGAECAGLVNTTDLYATIADVAGASKATALDSLSLRPYLADPETPSLRKTVYFERFLPNFNPAGPFPGTFQKRQQGARDKRYKLMFEYLPGSALADPDTRALFDLVADPLETVNLLDAPLSAELAAVYAKLRAACVAQGPPPWSPLGGGLAGTTGIPELSGEGSGVPGLKATVELKGALPGATGTLYIGYSTLVEPFACGTLVPTPDVLKPITVTADGAFATTLTWPALPPSAPLVLQAWIQDPGGPCEWSASHALQGLTAP